MANAKLEIFLTVLMLVALASPKRIPQACPKKKVQMICSNVKNDNWKFIGSQLTCEGDKSITSTTALSYVSSVVHTVNIYKVFNRSEFTAINIEDATIKFIPSGIGSHFENLKALQIESCGLLSVNKDYLKEFGSALELLSLPYNKIISIDADLLEYNQNLKAFWLNNNPIRHVDAKFFTNLENLKSLEFLADLNSGDCTTSQTFDTSSGITTIKCNIEKCTDITAKLETENLIDHNNSCQLAQIANLKSELKTILEIPKIGIEVIKQVAIMQSKNPITCIIFKAC